MNPQKIVLIGMPGSGKTKLAKRLSNKLHYTLIDTDFEIEQNESLSIQEIFSQKGEMYFRKLEHELLKNLLIDDKPKVIATGGGLPCFHDNMSLLLGNAIVIYIDVPLNTLYQRIASATHRPLLGKVSIEKLTQLYEQRKNIYKSAHHIIPFDGKDPLIKILEIF